MRRSSGIVVLALLAGALVSGCHSSSSAAAFTVTSASATIDTPVSLTVRGLHPGATVTLTASAVDGQHQRWTSSAQFTATGQGTVSSSQPATGGSYSGANAMGLFEDMLPPASAPSADSAFIPDGQSYPITITATVKGKRVASTTVTRSYPQTTVRHYRLADSGIYADLYLPAVSTGPHPAVLAFGGSEGGQDQNFSADLLAGRGYPTMALAYFKEPGLPSTLAGINLEYFTKALAILRRAPGVDPKHVLVYGVSRGSEAAQLLGAHFPNLVNGVIAGVPSSVTYGGYPDDNKASWLLNGKALPKAPLSDFDNPDVIDVPAAIIPDELIRGPIMLICGGDDTVWTSCPYENAIVARLNQHHFRYPVTSLKYPDAGHGVGRLGRYFSATDAQFFNQGGDRQATLVGSADAYGHALSLLGSLVGK